MKGLGSRASAALVVLAGLTVACGSVPTTAKVATAEEPTESVFLTKAAMRSDAGYWYDVIREVHPAPFERVSESEMIEQIERTIDSLPSRADPLRFMLAMTSLASRLRDSHTYFGYPEQSTIEGVPVFHYALHIRDGKLFWGSSDASVPIPPHARIASINRVGSEELVSWLRSVGIGELDSTIDRDGAASAPYVFWVHGMQAPFLVKWSMVDEAEQTTQVPGKRASASSEGHPADTLTFERTEEGFGVLTLKSMPAPEAFFPVLKIAFDEIARDEPEALIIDMRENIGGNTGVADMLFAFTTDRPYRVVGGKLWKVSERYKQVVEEQYDQPVPEYESAKNGTLLKFASPLLTPQDYGYRFQGPVCYLIGPGTASAAMMMANAVEDYDLAVLIGEPTSSPPNYFGEAYWFDLPESGIPAQTSVAYFVRANGDADDPNPVRPDILVKTSVEDRLQGRDPALEAAIGWAREQSRAD